MGCRIKSVRGQKNIQVIFVIIQGKADFGEVVEKFKSAGIFFQALSVAELSRRITYVDL